MAKRLAGLPLALATAGAYLHQSPFTFERYLQEYERRWNIDPRRPIQLQEYQDRTLYTTWGLSYTRLENEDPGAAKLLRLLAYFNNQSFWYELFHAGLTGDSLPWLYDVMTDDISFDGVMRTLTDYCFVEVPTVLGLWSMHSCVHDWTLAVLNEAVDVQQYWYAFNCVAASVDEDEWDLFGHVIYARLAAHATRLVHDRFQQKPLIYDIETSQLKNASCIAQLLQQQVQLVAAERMYLRALAGCEKALGPDHRSTLITVNNLGSLYGDQGKLAEAEQMYLRALAGCEKALGPDHMSTLNTVNNLGLLYGDQGKLAEAEEMYLRALAGNEKALGPDHTSTLNTVNNLGLLYGDQGKLAEAEQMYLRALAGKERALGPDHTSTLNTVNNLGLLYGDQGKLAEAEQMYLRALAGKERALGPDHTSTLNTVNNLGLLYGDQGKLAEAEQMYLRALAGYEKALGPDHTSTLNTVNNLGSLYRDQGKLAEAEEMYLRALAGNEKALGPDHTSTLRTVNNLGNLYRDQSRLPDMITIVSIWGRKHVNLFGHLGRSLLQNSDDSNAQVAFQHELVLQDGAMVFANILCDGCGCSITYTTKRRVCRRCPEIDLCRKCFLGHQAGIRDVPNCLGHSFLEIASEKLFGMEQSGMEQSGMMQETQTMSWLRNLTIRYPRKHVSDNES